MYCNQRDHPVGCKVDPNSVSFVTEEITRCYQVSSEYDNLTIVVFVYFTGYMNFLDSLNLLKNM